MTTELQRELTTLSAGELAEALAAGSVSATEAVEAHLARIESVDGALNAVVVRRFELARREAAAADARAQAGGPLPPLHGVPIVVKEMFDLEGTAATGGIAARVGQLATVDAPLVAELRRAGAIVLGKTNVPQMGMLFESDNPVFGRTNNPWNLERSAGGSSGGDAAIVAAGGAPLALATDGGGSIRQPAHCCGVQGFKPTAWRLPLVGQLSFPNFRRDWVQPGPLARTVADLDLALRVMSQAAQRGADPRVGPTTWPDFRRVDVGKLRIGYYSDDGFFPASTALRRAVDEAAASLRRQGATVEAFQPPDVDEACRIYFGVFLADGLAAMRRALAGSPRDWRIAKSLRTAGLPNFVRPLLAWAAGALGRDYEARLIGWVRRRETPVGEYWQLIHDESVYRQRFLAAMEAQGLDALIAPPYGLPALSHAQWYGTFPGSYCLLYNLLGFPAGTVAASRVRAGETERPASRDPALAAARQVDAGSAGLPVGVQVAARPWRDDLALAVMAALERHFRGTAEYPGRPPLEG
ncbi:MAG: amidase family protein [Pirellulales bacterium]